MTTPPPRTPPLPEPNQQQGYPPTEQSKPYGEQPPYVPPTDYAPPTGYAIVRARAKPAHPVRPAMVTVAAVLAFVWGGLTIISSLLSMVAGSLFSSVGSACARNDQSGLCAFVAGSGGLLITIGTALIVAAGLLMWGGVAALHGKNAKVLVVASGIQVVIQIVWMIDTGSIAFGIVGVIVPILLIVLMLSSASKSWFQAKRGATSKWSRS